MTKRTVRELKQTEFKEFVKIVSLAYPGMKITTEKEKADLEKRLKKSVKDSGGDVLAFGIFEGNELLGGALYYKFKMNNRGEFVNMAGIGLVAVSLLRKKEHVARDLLRHFLLYFKERDYKIASLYAFNPEFYRKMGFSLGTRFYCFRGAPVFFADHKAKSHLRYAGIGDADSLFKCYDSFAKRHHGMFLRKKRHFEKSLKDGSVTYLIYEESKKVKGYLAFALKQTWKENFLREKMDVHVIIADEADVLKEFSTFLHTQKDQIDRIEIDTYDPDFIHLLSDPRDGSESLRPFVAHQVATYNTAMMYRVLDAKGLLANAVKSAGKSDCPAFTLKIKDSFLEENSGELTVFPDRGTVSENKSSNITIKLDVLYLASLLTGVMKLEKLHLYGFVDIEISDKNKKSDIKTVIKEIDEYLTDIPYPICLTPF